MESFNPYQEKNFYDEYIMEIYFLKMKNECRSFDDFIEVVKKSRL